MTLTTHAILGAAAAELFPQHAALAFSAAFLSHFVLDAIPHQDYNLESYVEDRSPAHDVRKMDMIIGPAFWRDLKKIALDCLLGFALVAILFDSTDKILALALLGAVGGVLPDALQFIFFKFKHQPLLALEKFHVRIQEHRFPVRSFRFSLAMQFCLVLLVYGLLKYTGLI